MGYGGDFGDEPTDKNFVMDGLCFSDHTPAPGLVEYAKAIEPVQVLSLEGDAVTIINRYDFLNLDHLACMYSIVTEGETSTSPIGLDIPKSVLSFLALFVPAQWEQADTVTRHKTTHKGNT